MNQEFLRDFGQTVRTARKKRGWSQVVASHRLKIDYRHFQKIEGGKINLRLDTFLKICNILGIKLNIELAPPTPNNPTPSELQRKINSLPKGSPIRQRLIEQSGLPHSESQKIEQVQ